MPSVSDQTAVDLAIYAMAFQRYDSNADIQWRTPATVMTIESFVYLGIVTLGSTSDAAASYLLGGTGALIAIVGSATMRRLELTKNLDRVLLDIYEDRLGVTVPRIKHQARFGERVTQLRSLVSAGAPADDRLPPSVFYGSSRPRIGRITTRVDRLVSITFADSLAWSVLMIITGIGAIALAYILTSSPSVPHESHAPGPHRVTVSPAPATPAPSGAH